MVNQLMAMARASSRNTRPSRACRPFRGWPPKRSRDLVPRARSRSAATWATRGRARSAARAPQPGPDRARPAPVLRDLARSPDDNALQYNTGWRHGHLVWAGSTTRASGRRAAGRRLGPGIAAAERGKVFPAVLPSLAWHQRRRRPAWAQDRARDRSSAAPKSRWPPRTRRRRPVCRAAAAPPAWVRASRCACRPRRAPAPESRRRRGLVKPQFSARRPSAACCRTTTFARHRRAPPRALGPGVPCPRRPRACI